MKIPDRKIGFSHSNSISEIIEDLKKDMNVPDDDIILIVHVQRKDIEKVCGALELINVVQQIGTIRPTNQL